MLHLTKQTKPYNRNISRILDVQNSWIQAIPNLFSIAVCPNGYDPLPTSNACVALHTGYRTWNDSLIACKNEGADLPILDTDTLFDEFIDYMDNKAVACKCNCYFVKRRYNSLIFEYFRVVIKTYISWQLPMPTIKEFF